MASIMRQTAVWTGFVGAPGYSTFYHQVVGSEAASSQAGYDDIYNFFNALQAQLPATVDINVDTVWQVLDDVTGDVQSEGIVPQGAGAIAGTNGDGYAANSGLAVEWGTAQFLNGRRLRGRTYLVPAAGQFDTDGTLTSGCVTAVDTAADYIVNSSANFVVWHRPVNGAGGLSRTIATRLVRDHAYVLRSRGR